MGDVKPDSEDKGEMDDSGCVQDGSPPTIKKPPDVVENGYFGYAQLLDLSDDVLLCILKCCTPQDLKALGYSCQRLAGLVRDRTLWQRVDARSQPSGRKRLRWMLANVLNDSTTELLLAGYAREARGCLGHVERTPEPPARRVHLADCHDEGDHLPGENGDILEVEPDRGPEPPYPLHRHHARLHINAQQLPRFSGTPAWDEHRDNATERSAARADAQCGGPQFTVTPLVLAALSTQCSRLAALTLEYCNINCKKTRIGQLPPTLKKLSLRGTKCYNLPMDKSYLFEIHVYLPHLEFLDLSECEWMEPASLLPLSKLERLERLLMRDCYRLSEFVAYASLATRYGFRKLKVLDLRGSPVGDSEVSALGWVPALEELYLSPARPPPDPAEHSHCKGDPLPRRSELEPWEVEVEFGNQPDPDTSDVSDNSPSSSGFSNVATGRAFLQKLRECCNGGDAPHVTHDGDRIHVTLRRDFLGCRALNYGGDVNLEPDENRPGPSQRSKPLTLSHQSPKTSESPSSSKSSDTNGETQENNNKTSEKSSKVSDNGCNTSEASCNTLENSKKRDNRPATIVKDRDTQQRVNTESSEVTAENGANNKRMTRSKTADSTCKYTDNTPDSTNKREQRSRKSGTGDKSQESDENVKSSDKAQESTSKIPEANVTKRETRSKKLDTGNVSQGSDKNPEYSDKTPESTNKREKRPKKPDNDDISQKNNNMIPESNQNAPESDNTLEPNVNKRVTRSSKQDTGDKSADTNTKRETRSKKAEDKNDTNGQTPETKKRSPESYKGKRKIITEIPESSNEPTTSKKMKVVYQKEINEGASSSNDTNYSAFQRNLHSFVNSTIRKSLSMIPDRDKATKLLQAFDKNKSSTYKGKRKITPDSDEPTSSNKKPKGGLPNDINEGASTSSGVRNAEQMALDSSVKNCRKARSLSPKGRTDSDNSESEDDTSTKPNNGSTSSTSSEASQNGQQFENYVRFRQNQEPVIIQCPVAPQPEPEEAEDAEQRHRVLYVNVGQQLHAVYRLLPNRPIFHAIRNRNWRPNIRNVYYAPPTPHIDSASLVTDAAVRRFGRSDGDDINYVHIGPNGPYPPGGMIPNTTSRPNRSNLRILSITGFRNITDRSLVHLATSAPHLRVLDFTETGVTDQGVENFKSLRPDCEVTYSKFDEDNNGDAE